MLHSRSSWGCADGRCVRRPHLSFYFPQEFGALYPPAEQIAPPAHPNPPTGMPLAAWHEGNFNNKWGKPCNDTRPFRRAYYSAVSFTDDNIGKLLAEVDTRQADEGLMSFKCVLRWDHIAAVQATQYQPRVIANPRHVPIP